jgi:hypothetical protein
MTGVNGAICVVGLDELELELVDEVLPFPLVVVLPMVGGRNNVTRRTSLGDAGFDREECPAVVVDVVAADVALPLLAATKAGTTRFALGLPKPVTRL